MEIIRSFVAIELPADLKEQIDAYQKQLKRFCRNVRWVNSQSLHVTLKFLGNRKIWWSGCGKICRFRKECLSNSKSQSEISARFPESAARGCSGWAWTANLVNRCLICSFLLKTICILWDSKKKNAVFRRI
ncbi:MAG: hypothetical protein GXO77_11095 [Calditrichaeota bacterium]|nr:hypothetical protein [Calditrichota bacterium]